jgi:acyl carrier protein
VQEVVVMAREEVAGDPRLVAYVTARTGMTIAVDALRAHLHASLPDFMVPSQYVMLADMPRTPNLKVDRKALPAPAALNATPVVLPGVAPDGELERLIAAVWCDVLRLPAVGNRDNFFDLGGHSLLVVQVHQRLTTALRLSFPITDLFRFSTVQAIAGHVATLQTAAVGTTGSGASPAPGTAPRDDIARRAELRRAAAQRHVRPRS